jgi:hypothetical protein
MPGEGPILTSGFIIQPREVKRHGEKHRIVAAPRHICRFNPFTRITRHVNSQPPSSPNETINAPRSFLFVAIGFA